MAGTGERWAIVLAAGDGTRLRTLTTDRSGVATPKQYCSLRPGRTLLHDAVARARRVVSRERIVTIVAERHRTWWRTALSDLPDGNIIVQPGNRGTAAGILLPLLAVLSRDPEARIVVLPSDHFVAREGVLARSLRQALTELEGAPGALVLLGITPDGAEPEYGWIVPRPGGATTLPVASFVEKPGPDQAARLLAQGGAWNSFVFAATGRALLDLYRKRLPWLTMAFQTALTVDGPPPFSLARLYEAIEPADFSRDLLQGPEEKLRLLPVPSCGWTDLGTPERVARCLSGLRPRRARRPAARRRPGVALDLSLAVASSAF